MQLSCDWYSFFVVTDTKYSFFVATDILVFVETDILSTALGAKILRWQCFVWLCIVSGTFSCGNRRFIHTSHYRYYHDTIAGAKNNTVIRLPLIPEIASSTQIEPRGFPTGEFQCCSMTTSIDTVPQASRKRCTFIELYFIRTRQRWASKELLYTCTSVFFLLNKTLIMMHKSFLLTKKYISII